MKVSQITPDYLKDYLRTDEPGEIEEREIETALSAAKEYAKAYTGISGEEMEKHEDITAAILVLTADFYENKSLYLDYKSKEINKMVTFILDMHSVNLI